MTDTWKMVPLEPTEEMLDAYWKLTGESKEMRARTHAYMRRYYKAMLAAAPGAPEQKPVAYAAFAENGNIRIWSQDPGRIDATAAVDGFEVKPLYTHPVPNDIDAIKAENERLREALKMARDRLELLIRVYPDDSDKCDHPTATRHVLNQTRAAINGGDHE